MMALGGGWSTGSAAAQDDPAALIEEGVTLRERGQDDEALARFRRAYERAPTPQALVQIALAEQALGRWVDAHAHLTEALRAGNDPWIAERRAVLEGALQQIQSRVGRLDLRDGVDGAQVFINGAEAGTLPLTEPLTVPTGTVVLEVRAPGYVTLRRTLELRPGGLARERVPLVPEGESRPAEAESGAGASDAGTNISPIGPIVLGAGVLTLGVAGVFGALALTRDGDLSGRCGGSRCLDTPEHRAIDDEMRTFGTATDVLLVIGGVTAITGAILTFTLTEGDSETAASAAFHPGGGELSIRGSF